MQISSSTCENSQESTHQSVTRRCRWFVSLGSELVFQSNISKDHRLRCAESVSAEYQMKRSLLLCSTGVFFAAVFAARVSSQSPPAQQPPSPAVQSTATFVGSQSCRRCHTATYERWSKTRMAN